MATTDGKPRETNEDRRAAAISKKIQKAHDWRVKVWADRELAIQTWQQELVVLGREAQTIYDVDFTDLETVRRYAEMSLNG